MEQTRIEIAHSDSSDFVAAHPLPAKCKCRQGCEFSPRDAVWKLQDLTGRTTFDFEFFSGILSPELLHSFKLTLIFYAGRASYSLTANCFGQAKTFFAAIRSSPTRTGSINAIRAVDVTNYRGSLSEEHEWYLGALRGFFLKWSDLGYPGIDPEAYKKLRHLRLKGNIKGEAVSTMDPESGPFTEIELHGIRDRISDSFSKGEMSVREFALVWLFMALGARPIQYAALKLCDLKCASAADGAKSYMLEVPSAKGRGDLHRTQFKSRSLIPQLGKVIEALIEDVQQEAKEHGIPLHDNSLMLPMFPDWHSIDLPGFDHHSNSDKIAGQLAQALKRVAVYSERTGKPLHITTRRFRYTLGTRAAAEGHGLLVIAELLDHTDTQNALVYIRDVPEIIDRLDVATALAIAPLARAFQGDIVKDKAAAPRGDDPCSRVSHPLYAPEGTGNCGRCGVCSAIAPIACYTCKEFHAWSDAPHNRVLEFLIAERERLRSVTGDKRIAEARDRDILAVAQVVQSCRQMREGANEQR